MQCLKECLDRATLQVIKNEEASLQALQRHLREMNATLEALETLPNKISHDIMVPFGTVAMFPGLQLIHVATSSNTRDAHDM
jgi:hypothetical protein